MPPVPCTHCSAVEARAQCGGCKSAFYCSKHCQRAHWEGHRVQCTRTLRVGSFNVVADQFFTNLTVLASWRTRLPLVLGVLRTHNFALFGVQEDMANQVQDLEIALGDEYGRVGVGWDGARAGAFNSIFYRADTVRVLDTGTLWLTDTPSVPTPQEQRDRWEYTCTWGRFQLVKHPDITFRVYNTHLHASSEPRRMVGVQVILRHVDKHAGQEPVIVLGDLNSQWDTPPIRTLLSAGFQDTHRAYVHKSAADAEPHSTHHGTTRFRIHVGKIDYILCRALTVKRAEIIEYNRAGVYPSDHYPISATVQFLE